MWHTPRTGWSVQVKDLLGAVPLKSYLGAHVAPLSGLHPRYITGVRTLRNVLFLCFVPQSTSRSPNSFISKVMGSVPHSRGYMIPGTPPEGSPLALSAELWLPPAGLEFVLLAEQRRWLCSQSGCQVVEDMTLAMHLLDKLLNRQSLGS